LHLIYLYMTIAWQSSIRRFHSDFQEGAGCPDEIHDSSMRHSGHNVIPDKLPDPIAVDRHKGRAMWLGHWYP
jgi:hypothetical protein